MTACYQLLSGAVPDLASAVDGLRARLARTRWPTLPPASRKHGVSEAMLSELVESWPGWLAQRGGPAIGDHRHLRVNGQRVHCVRFSGIGTTACLLLHGWPTSFLAFHRLIPLLRSVCSEIVLASLPGFGTSARAQEDRSFADAAADLIEAMAALGHDHFIVHGEDWGSVVAREMGRTDSDRVRGVHVSAGLAGFMPQAAEPGEETERAEGLRAFMEEGGAYLRLQATRPDSLAYALADSPVGLLAWQLDKFELWQGDLPHRFGLGTDFILANATLYWVTGCIGTSMRVYTDQAASTPQRSDTRTGVSVFGRGDFASRTASSRHNHLISWNEHRAGGHVAALDAPELLAADLADFIQRIEGDDA